jgi:serine/threonine protein kinase
LNQEEDKIEFGKPADLTSLGPYTIDSRLGQGGMGIVYLATDKNLGRPVAIKVLHPHLLKHENLKQRFRREARMHAKLMHPNIVTLLSLYEDDTYMALVMEVINGEDLKAYLRKNTKLSIKDKLKIAVEILKGLEAAHEFGMVHRDLKPANVLISTRGEVKLLDFGLAKPESGGDDLTQSGATVGSFRYMAPEQILNNPLDARTDLYAFGILLFFMLLGKLPFDTTGSGGEFEIMEKQVRDPAPKPHDLDASIPVPLSNLILKLLEKNKHHRPESAAVVRAEIEKMLEQLQFLSSPKKVEPKVIKVDRTPTSSITKHQIAKQWLSYGHFHWQKTLGKLVPNINKSFADLSVVAVVFIMLGLSSISILSMAEDTVAQTQATQEKLKKQATKEKAVAKAKETTSIAKAVIDKPDKTKPIEAKPIKNAVNPAPKAKPKPKPKVKPKYHPKPKPRRQVAKSLTYKVKHQVTRKDKTKVSSNKPHEFRGGSHVFYPELVKKGWFSSFKRGDSTVLFDKSISLSKIVIHKASVGDLDFKHGFIEIEVKPAGKRKWKKVFSQKDKDIDKKVVIQGFKKDYPSVDGVRIKFKTQDPITIGPIDLLQ